MKRSVAGKRSPVRPTSPAARRPWRGAPTPGPHARLPGSATSLAALSLCHEIILWLNIMKANFLVTNSRRRMFAKRTFSYLDKKVANSHLGTW